MIWIGLGKEVGSWMVWSVADVIGVIYLSGLMMSGVLMMSCHTVMDVRFILLIQRKLHYFHLINEIIYMYNTHIGVAGLLQITIGKPYSWVVWQARSDEVGVKHHPRLICPARPLMSMVFKLFTKKQLISFLHDIIVIVSEQHQTVWYSQADQTGQTRHFSDWYGSCWGIN